METEQPDPIGKVGEEIVGALRVLPRRARSVIISSATFGEIPKWLKGRVC